MNKNRYGDANVYYDGTGRVFYQGRGTYPKGGPAARGGRSPRRDDDYRSYDPQRDRGRRAHEPDPYRAPRPGPYTVESTGYRPDERRGMPPPRRYDDGRPPPKEYYNSYRPDSVGYDDDVSFPEKRGREREGSATLLMGVVFFVLGIFLLSLAVIEILICLDHSHYARFWAGFLVSSKTGSRSHSTRRSLL